MNRLNSTLVIAALALCAHCTRIADKILDDTSSASSSSTSIAAVRVYGQLGSFSSGSLNNGGITASSLNQPLGIAADSSGVYIADKNNNRMLFFAGTSTTASRVYGQGGSFTVNTGDNGGTSATSALQPLGVALESGGVYMSEGAYRMVYYSGTSTTATRVYGQAGSFTTRGLNNGGLSATSLNSAYGIAHDGSGVYLCDYANHRVLYYSGTSTTATRVYGQGGAFNANTLNNGGVSANSLNQPYNIAVDGSGVFIVDYSNHRVLYFAGTSTTATRVYGQAGSFATNAAGVSATNLNLPSGIAVSPTGIYIADSGNHRVLFFPGTSTTATRVYGQDGSFTSGSANNGGISATSLNGPAAVHYRNGDLYVSDYNNHRVLVYTGQP